MSKTIQIEIPAPPDGWVYEKRIPKKGEEYICFDMKHWRPEIDKGSKRPEYHTMPAYAYRVRDEYAERYEALKLPDGFAMTCQNNSVWWCNRKEDFQNIAYWSIRIILNGKAIKP